MVVWRAACAERPPWTRKPIAPQTSATTSANEISSRSVRRVELLFVRSPLLAYARHDRLKLRISPQLVVGNRRAGTRDNSRLPARPFSSTTTAPVPEISQALGSQPELKSVHPPSGRDVIAFSWAL